MNWETVSALSEIAGAIAVILTLVYLAIQIKESTKASRSTAVTDATSAVQSWYQELGSNSETAKLFLNGMSQPDALSNADLLSDAGTLDIALRDSIGTAVRSVNHLPGIRFYWRQRKPFFQPEFIAWVEELLAREPLTEMEPYWQDGTPA